MLFNLVTTSEDLDQFDLKQFKDYLLSIFGERLAGFLHTTNDETGDRTIATTGEIKLKSQIEIRQLDQRVVR